MPKFVPRQRKHKVLAREKARQNDTQDGGDASSQMDSNALEILPDAQKADREAKRAKLRDELKGEVKVSGKKAKRLEKYIDNKLKKDENRVLLAELAKNKIDTSLFSSSRSLGQGKETKRQALSRALRERRAGVGQDDDNEILFETKDVSIVEESDDDFKAYSKTTHSKGRESEASQNVTSEANGSTTSDAKTMSLQKQAVAVGSGLKRPLDLDDEGKPIIQ
ncbi:hypothetical protein PC116_g33247, partial [Phytophthora cactorum]